MTSRTCEEYNQQENGKQGSQEDEVRRRKKTFQREVSEENAPEENGTSNRLFPATFIPPLTPVGQGALDKVGFHTALAQKGIDFLQPVAQTQVVHVADDGGQLRTKFLRERKNLSCHDVRLLSNFRASENKQQNQTTFLWG